MLTFVLVFQHYDNLLNLGYKNVDCRVYVDTNHLALLKLPSNKPCKYEILPGFYFWIKMELMLKSNYFILITELVWCWFTSNISPAHFMIITITSDWTNVTAGHLEDVL